MGTLREHTRPGSNTDYCIAAPLSHGSNPNSNMAGRRREDDENVVAAFNPIGGGTQGMSYGDVAPTWKGNHGSPAVLGVGVRRLTPTECERLQALPDDWTAHGPDSRRYAALGDAVTASVAEWIGNRLRTLSRDTVTTEPDFWRPDGRCPEC